VVAELLAWVTEFNVEAGIIDEFYRQSCDVNKSHNSEIPRV